MKVSRATLLAGTVLAISAGAQTVVVPGKFATARGNTYNWYVFSATPHQPNIAPYHGQWIYDSVVVPAPVVVIGSMSLRRMSSSGNTLYQGDADIDISICMSPVNSTTASTTFAGNLGTGLVNIFPKAKVNLPNSQYVGPPNLPPWVVSIPFRTPFVYVASSGMSLLLDIKSGGYAAPGGGSVGDNWFIDCGKAEEGQWRYALSSFPGQGCAYSNSKVSGGGGSLSASLRPGGSFYFTQSGMPANLVGFVILGYRGPGSMWGPISLPLDLSFLGAGTCQLGVSMDITLPSSTDAGGTWRWPTINIPNNPALVGFSIFEQAIYLDPGANPANLVTTFVMEWPIGSGALPGGCEIYVLKDSGQASGTKRLEVPIVKFN